MSPEPMVISIPETDVLDLRGRLAATRWPVRVEGYGWDEGTDAGYLRDFVRYWAGSYDWRDREARMNAFSHHLAKVDGETVHFILAKGKGPRPVPLLLLHGWPSSFVQMLEIIPLLTAAGTDGTVAFDVIAASLPGYPFSGQPTRPGMGFARISDLMLRLMTGVLGYDRFAVRGSDQGGLVLRQLALRHPDRIIGLHRSGISPFAAAMPDDLDDDEVRYRREVALWAERETDYARLQAKRPETLVPALTDSPVGLAGWFLEKFQRWGDCREGLDACFGRDRLIDNLSLHWFTGSAASATRLYREAALEQDSDGRVEVPTAIMMPLHDGVTVPAPRRWCERSYDVRRWTVMERGGHFPEWEQPALVASDIRAFFTELTTERDAPRPEPTFAETRGGPDVAPVL